jgi:hypothetical protein
MTAKERDPKDTIRILDRLVELGLLDELRFRRMHHFGDSLSNFRKYCSTIDSFQHDSENRRLHQQLQELLELRGRSRERTGNIPDK